MPRVVSAWQRVRAWAVLCLFPAGLAAQGKLFQLPAEDVAFATRHWHSGTGLPQNTINAVRQTRDGRLWLATLGGLCSFDGERMRVLDPITAPQLRSSRFTCLYEGRDGTLWIGSDLGGLASLRNGELQVHAGLPAAVIRSVAEDGRGRLWVGADDGLWCQENGVFQRIVEASLGSVHVVWSRRDGTLLVGTDTALWSLDDRTPRRLASGDILCFAELGERLLVGTQHGLRCLDGDELAPWQPAPGLHGTILSLLVARDGALWIGTDQRVHRVAPPWLPHVPRIAPDPSALAPITYVHEAQAARALHEDREGGIWVGHTERGVVRYVPADVRTHGLRQGLPRRGLAAVAGDGRGGLLVAAASGLFEGGGDGFRSVPEVVPFGALRTLCVDSDGVQWIVSAAGLLRRDARGVELWCGLGPVRCDRIQAIVCTAD